MNTLRSYNINNEQVQVLAKNLRNLLTTNNVSETELARSTNTSVMTLRRLLSGDTEDPRISTLKLISDYFDVSIDSLLTDNFQKPIQAMAKKKPIFIPILNWNILKTTDSINSLDLHDWKEWYPIVSDNEVNENTFALESKHSMQPRFPLGTLFIIKPNEIPLDGDIVLVKMKIEHQLSLRELIIDAPKWQLQPVISGSEVIFYDELLHDILGVVILTLLHKRS